MMWNTPTWFQVIGKMRTMATDDSVTTPNSSFLLDDDSRYEYDWLLSTAIKIWT